MKLSSLLFVTLFAANGAAFAPLSYRTHSVRDLLIVLKEAPEKEELKPAMSTDEKIKQDFESEENSPAKIDAVAKGQQAEDDKIDETKKFDPTTLWTDHSGKF